MRVQYYLFDCVNGAMLAWRWVNIAAIEVDAIGVYSEVSSRYAVWIEDREYVKDEGVSEQLTEFGVSGELVDNTSHHMRSRHFSWMHPCSNNNHLLLSLKLLRLVSIHKQQRIIKALLSFSDSLV